MQFLFVVRSYIFSETSKYFVHKL